MKKVTSLLLLVGVAAFGLVACGDNVVPPDGGNVEGVTVTPSVLNIAVGGSGALSADVDGDPNNSVTWSSNAESVATVDGDGNVTGVSEGNAVVTATSTVDNAHSASAEVNVTELEQATISIAGWRSVNPTATTGDVQNPGVVGTRSTSGNTRLIVTANVDEGDADLTTVELLLNGDVAATQDFAAAATSQADEESQIQGQTSNATVDMAVDSDAFEGDPVGDPIMGTWPNDLYTVAMRINTESGASATAEVAIEIEFDNENQIRIDLLEGNTAVNQGTGDRWFGGSDLTWAVTPLIFDMGLSVSQLDITNGSAADITGGPGSDITLAETPFTFTAAAGDNTGVVDAGASFTPADIRDADGQNVTGAFDISGTSLRLDWEAPVVVLASEITQDGVDITEDNWYNEGAFGVSGLSDAGVEGITMVFDADVISTSEEPDYEDVTSFADLMEHGDAGAPMAPSDVKVLVRDLQDALGNMTDLDPATGTPIDNAGSDVVDAEDNASEYHGVDHTAPAASNLLPAGGGSATFVFNGNGTGFPGGTNELNADIVDPDLADGNAPSLKNDAPAMFEIQDDAGTTLYGPVANGDLAFATGAPTYSGDPSVTTDGPRVAIFTFEDNAVDPNDAEQVFEYILDTTPPSFGALNPAPASTSTQATSVLQDIGGTVTDANVISTATVTVRVTSSGIGGIGDHDDGDASDGAPDGNDTCEVTDELLDVDNGDLVTGNNRDISNGTDSIDFSETFEINDPFPAGAGTVTYCYFISATDEALDNAGDPDGNPASLSTESTIDWQN